MSVTEYGFLYGEGGGQGRGGYRARANEVVYGNGVGWARWKDPTPRYHVSRDKPPPLGSSLGYRTASGGEGGSWFRLGV